MTGILFLLDIEYAPFLDRYCKILDANNEKYEIITWDRMNNREQENVISFKKKASLGDSKLKKLLGFFQYSLFLNKTINSRKYDKLIVLTTLTGFVAFKSLIGCYKNKYIFDIRDYTYENNWLFRIIEKIIIEYSYCTVISSRGFLSFLPNYNNYVVCHNILPDEINRAASTIGDGHYFNNRDKIVISFIGAVRHFELNKQMVDIFGNDDRFELRFHGYGVAYEALKKYVEDCSYDNVILTGKYDRSNKDELMKGASVINGYYSEDDMANRTGISNKFYDALIYKIPFWGNPNCYVGQLALHNGFGIEAYLDETVKENIINAVNKIDYHCFSKRCNEALGVVLEEDAQFIKSVESFINEY